MDYLQGKVWEMLSQDEQVVLSLLHAQDVRIASVAKIMGKRTYQIRRLNYQAIKMYRLFYDLFEVDPSREFEVPGASPLIRQLIIQVIDGGKLSIVRLKLAKSFNTTIANINSEYKIYLMSISEKLPLYMALLREIDRYRNRFLPKEYQWPSPYRRKRNRAYKNLASKLWEYDSYLLHLSTKDRGNIGYIPLSNKGRYSYTTLSKSPASLDTITNTMGIPIFDNIDEATYLARIIREYHMAHKRTPQMGSKYLKDLRVTLEKAINYKELFKIPEDITVDRAWMENSGAIRQPKGAKRAKGDLFST